MVKIGKYFAYTLFFLSALIYFLPKVNTYYLLESELKKYTIILSKEKIINNTFSLSIKDTTLSIKGIDSANISNINISLFILYNTIVAENIVISPIASNMIPLKITKVKVKYSLLNPSNIEVNADGDFGKAILYYDIFSNLIKAKITPSKIMLKKYQKTLRKLKKSKDGSYTYEQNI